MKRLLAGGLALVLMGSFAAGLSDYQTRIDADPAVLFSPAATAGVSLGTRQEGQARVAVTMPGEPVPVVFFGDHTLPTTTTTQTLTGQFGIGVKSRQTLALRYRVTLTYRRDNGRVHLTCVAATLRPATGLHLMRATVASGQGLVRDWPVRAASLPTFSVTLPTTGLTYRQPTPDAFAGVRVTLRGQLAATGQPVVVTIDLIPLDLQ